MNKIKSILATLLRFIKHIKISKKTIILIVLAIILCAIIVCIIDFISPRNIVGIQQKKHIYLLDPKAVSTISNDFDPSTFSQSTFSTATTTGKNISINYGISGDSTLDASIKTAIESYAKSLVGSFTDLVFTSEARAFKDLIFMTLSTADGSHLKTFIFNKNGIVETERLIKSGFEQIAINSVKNKLSTEFAVDLTTGNQMTLDAIKQKTYRIASNGLIIIIPTKNLPSALQTSPYYEVLVPNAEIYDYLK